MSWLRNPDDSRASLWHDHAITAAATLAAAAALGAALVILTSMAERLAGRELPALWVLGIGMMVSPKLAWIGLLPGAAALLGLRRFGLGGWLPAALIGAALMGLGVAGRLASPADYAIQIAIGATIALFYWAILRWRLKRREIA